MVAPAPAAGFNRGHFYVQTEALKVDRQTVEIAGAHARDELGHVPVEQQLGYAFGADARRKHDAIGARLNELAFRGR